MRFFFYGTLEAGSRNAVTEALHAQLRALGPAMVRGSMRDTGHSPHLHTLR